MQESNNAEPIIKETKQYADETNKRLIQLNFRHSTKHSLSCNVTCVRHALHCMPYALHLPLPVVYSDLRGPIRDPYLRLISRKQDQQLTIENIKVKYKAKIRKMNKRLAYNYYHRIERLLKKDPDPYFHCNYNWYYTGGNLNTHNIFDDIFILHATNQTELSVAKIEKQNREWTVKRKNVLCDDLTCIYQIDSTVINVNCVACVRQKDCISVYDVTFDNSGKTNCELINNMESNVPFAGVSVNKCSLNEYATVDVKRCVRIYDTYTGKQKYRKYLEYDTNVYEGNNFSQLKYIDQHVFTCINTSELNLLDIRTKTACTTLNRCAILLTPNVFSNISIINDSSCYISTVHDILQLDLRNMSVVRRWSHSFDSAPILSDLICHDNNNTICISSGKTDEKLLLGEHGPKTFMPKYLPTLTTAMECTMLEEPKINASIRSMQRLKLSTTGLSLLAESAGMFTVFSANSLGDVFSYEVTDHHRYTEDDSWNVNTFKKWVKHSNNDGLIRDLNYMDKVVLRDIKLDIHEDVQFVEDPHKLNRIAYTSEALKRRTISFESKLSNAWYEHGLRTLDDIEELPAEENVTQWLSHISEVSLDDKTVEEV